MNERKYREWRYTHRIIVLSGMHERTGGTEQDIKTKWKELDKINKGAKEIEKE